MQLFYHTELEDNLKEGSRITLTTELSHHLTIVLRTKVGDTVMVCNGRGWLYGCSLEVASKRESVLLVLSAKGDFGSESQYDITVAIAPTKNIDRLEWAVEKMVEVGVSRIVPIVSARSERKSLKVDRLRRIALSAAQQSLKGHLAVVEEVQPLKQFLSENPGGFIAHCNEGSKVKIPMGRESYTVLIGPEGDFSIEEVELAHQWGYRAITLGESRLRTETAAVCAAYLCTL